jgi:hypothetical protein
VKRAIITFGIAILAFLLGAMSILLLRRASNSSVPQGWMNIVPATDPVMFDMAAIKSDIPVPKPGRLSGRVKFLSRDNDLQIGYTLKLPMNPNPVSALPERYRRTTQISGFDVGPPDQVIYTGAFTFILRDGDGFTLAKIKGPSENISSASDNPIQGTTEATVPESAAEHTKQIAVSFDAEKCNVCE